MEVFFIWQKNIGESQEKNKINQLPLKIRTKKQLLGYVSIKSCFSFYVIN